MVELLTEEIHGEKSIGGWAEARYQDMEKEGAEL